MVAQGATSSARTRPTCLCRRQTGILGAIRSLNRLELVGEAMRHALETLAKAVPAFLQGRVSSKWLERYGQPLSDYRLPKEESEQVAFAEQIGVDGRTLLDWIYSEEQWQGLRIISTVETLRKIWVQQFYEQDRQLHWRSDKETPSPTYRIALRCVSPAR